jgi:hypothetical protein
MEEHRSTIGQPGLPHESPLDIALQIANLSLGAPLGMAYAFPLLLWLALPKRD